MRSKKAVYNIITNLILQIIVIIYGFIVPKIIISKYGSITNGLISSITQFLAYISLLESGFGPIVKSILYKPIASKNKQEIRNILKASETFFRKIALIFLIYIFLLCVFYPYLINNNFSYLYTVSLILIISISTFAEYFFGMTYTLYIQANQRTYIISLIQVFTYIISATLIIILAKFNISVHIIKLVSCLVFLLRPLLLNIYVKKKFNINFKNVDKKYSIKQKWDGLAQHIASVIHSNTDITLLTIFCTLGDVSVYAVYYLVIKGIRSLIMSFINGIDALFGDMMAKKETDNMNRKFGMYEELYFTICTIIFTCSMLLITPFISVYTRGINDVNYIRYFFGYLIVISEYIWAIRQPYNELVKAAGHFKETKKGAWVECTLNIVVSMIFIFKYGIIGVAIGTIVAMTIRTIEFIYHANKYILGRNIFISIKKISLIVIETILTILVVCVAFDFKFNNYFNFILNGIIVFTVTSLITVTINCIVCSDNYIELLRLIKRNNHLKTKKKG